MLSLSLGPALSPVAGSFSSLLQPSLSWEEPQKTAKTPLLFPLCWSLNSKSRLPSLAHSGTSSFSPHPALPGK